MTILKKPDCPSPREIQQARHCSGLSTSEAGALVWISGRTLEDYEQGHHPMPPDRWEALEYKLSLILSEAERQHHRDYSRRPARKRVNKLARIVDSFIEDSVRSRNLEI